MSAFGVTRCTIVRNLERPLWAEFAVREAAAKVAKGLGAVIRCYATGSISSEPLAVFLLTARPTR